MSSSSLIATIRSPAASTRSSGGGSSISPVAGEDADQRRRAVARTPPRGTSCRRASAPRSRRSRSRRNRAARCRRSDSPDCRPVCTSKRLTSGAASSSAAFSPATMRATGSVRASKISATMCSGWSAASFLIASSVLQRDGVGLVRAMPADRASGASTITAFEVAQADQREVLRRHRAAAPRDHAHPAALHRRRRSRRPSRPCPGRRGSRRTRCACCDSPRRARAAA